MWVEARAELAGRGIRDIAERAVGLPLRWRIGTLVLLGLVAIFALFGALGAAIAEDGKQRTISEWLNVTSSTAGYIDSELEVEYQRLERLAATVGTADPSRQRQVLDDAAGQQESFVGASFLLDATGAIRWSASMEPLRPADYVAADPGVLKPLTTGIRYASGIHTLDGILPQGSAIMAVPVRGNDGRPSGVLGIVVRPDRGVIGDLVASARGLAHSGHAELVDQNDVVIASSESSHVLGHGEHPDFYEPLLLSGKTGVGLTAPVGPNDPADLGQRHEMAFVPLRTVPWGLALGGSEAELSADADRWWQQISLFGALTLAVALLLVWFTTRGVARPILALAAASRQIAAGDLETAIPVGGEGEVRVLAQAFDQMRLELRRALAAEAEVDRLKDEFLATVSHELRTPLGFIMGYATTLLLPDAPDDAAATRRCLQVIADASNELKELVDNLLDMAKIGSGSLSVSPVPTPLAPLARAAVERIRVRGEGHHFVTAMPASLPEVQADAHRVEQVLYNLLDNAIKYSPDGGRITVQGSLVEREVVVSVVDEGLGIPADELPTLFERFHRGQIARSRGIAGTGLGLAICRGIVEAHGGRIWAESPPAPNGDRPRGTAIRFTMPVAGAGGPS